MGKNIVSILQEIRGSQESGVDAPSTSEDGIYHDLVRKTVDADGSARLGVGIYGSIKALVDSVSALNARIAEVDAVYAGLGNIAVVTGIASELTSLAGDKATLDSLFADKVKLDSLFADKTTLDSLFADKAAIDSLAADKTTLDSLYADKAKLDRLFVSVGNIDRLYASATNIDTVVGSIPNIDTVAVSSVAVAEVAGNIASVNTNAANIAAIQNASANANSAAAAAVASETSRVASSQSASTAASHAVATAADAVNTSNDAISTSNDAISTSNDAVNTSNDAISTSNDAVSTAADAISTSNDAANTAADAISTSNDATNTAADAISTGADAANTAADVISTGADVISTSNDAISTSNDAVSTAADAVSTAADVVVANKILGLSTVAQSLVAGSPSSSSYNPTTGVMTFGIPIGNTGAKGDPFSVNSQGITTDRSSYDTQPTGFSFLDTQTSLMYFKNSASSGDWSIGISFGKGDKGDTGIGIVSIVLTGTVGDVDTYTITYSDATSTTFEVVNASGDMVTTNNLSDVANVSIARSNLGLTIGSDIASYDATLEIGATADQTAAEILTLVKTVDGAGSGLDADLLDGLSSSELYTKAELASAFGRLSSPLLDLPLKNSLSMKAGVGAVTFSRSTTGTYIDRYGVLRYAAIDEPRFEKDGLLIEGTSTNLLANSNAFILINTSATQNQIAPDGALNSAFELAGDGTLGEHFAQKIVAVPDDTSVYTNSMYVKKGTQDTILYKSYLTGGTTVTSSAYFTFSTETITGTGTVTKLSDGWYRLTNTLTNNASGNVTLHNRVFINNGAVSTSTDTLYAYGMQSEELPFASSYIPTTTAAVTRGADDCSVDSYNNHPLLSSTNQYSVCLESQSLGSGTQIYYSLGYGDSGVTSYSLLRQEGTGLYFYRGAYHNALTADTVSNSSKTVVSVSNDAVSGYVNGVLSFSRNLPLFGSGGFASNMYLGKKGNAPTEHLFGHIKNFKVYDVALTPKEVALL